jgi:quinol monooxygenase YgiN
VLITIEYQVSLDRLNEFQDAIQILGKSRKRDGAYAWGVFEHTEKPGRFIETFNVESWLEHRRQHERVTDSDRLLQLEIRTLLVKDSEPLINHYVTPHVGAG